MMSFHRALHAFLALPVASMSSDVGALDQLRVQTIDDGAVVAGMAVSICQKAVAAFRLGLYDVVGSLVAILHDGCKADATAVAISMADGRRSAEASMAKAGRAPMSSHGGSIGHIDPIAAVVGLFQQLDDLMLTNAKSAAALVTMGLHVSAARGDLMEALQLLSAEEAVKLDIGALLIDTIIKLLVRSVDYAERPAGGGVSSTATARSSRQPQQNRSEERAADSKHTRRRALLAESELYRAAAGTLINLIQHSKPNKDITIASLSDLVRVIEHGEDYSVQVMCLEVLFRLHFHNAAMCREIIASSGDNSSASYLNDALRHLQTPVQDELLRTLEHVTQQLVAKRQQQQEQQQNNNNSSTSLPPTTLHLDAVGVDVVTLATSGSNGGGAASTSAAEEIYTLAGPTMLHFNISFMVFRTMDNISHVTIPYTDVRSVRISRANKILISLHRVPDVVTDQLVQAGVPPLQTHHHQHHVVEGHHGRWGPLGIQVCVTAARIAQLRQSSVLDWIAAAKAVAAGATSATISTMPGGGTRSSAAPPHQGHAASVGLLGGAASEGLPTTTSTRGASKRPRSTSNAAATTAVDHQPRRAQSATHTDRHVPHESSEEASRTASDRAAKKSESTIQELQTRVQSLVDGYRCEMSERRDALEALQRRAIEDFLAHLKHVRHEARQRVDFINQRMESLQSTWETVREQELPKLSGVKNGYEAELKAVEVARVKELKVKVDASLGHLSDSMNRLVEQGGLSMLQKMRSGE